MRNLTVCYIEKDNKYLMLHRTKKNNDVNKDKWIGVGGKIEYKESPEECIVREVKEETGLTLLNYKLRCIITFTSTVAETEYIYVFTIFEYHVIKHFHHIQANEKPSGNVVYHLLTVTQQRVDEGRIPADVDMGIVAIIPTDKQPK